MAYKDILVYLDPTAESVERLRFSVDLAKTHVARLIGVDASTLEGAAATDSSEVIRRMFDEATRAASLKTVFVPPEKPGEGDAFTHCVDLIVAPAPGGPARDVIRRGALDRALTESGAPMLILPPDWTPGPVGQNMVIAWNAGREALRAVHDAMPLLEKARKVTVFCFSSRPSDLRASAVMLVQHLRIARRHGPYFGLDQHRRPDGDRGAVREPRHAGRGSDRRRRLRSFAGLRGPFRRREPRSDAPAVVAGADVALTVRNPARRRGRPAGAAGRRRPGRSTLNWFKATIAVRADHTVARQKKSGIPSFAFASTILQSRVRRRQGFQSSSRTCVPPSRR